MELGDINVRIVKITSAVISKLWSSTGIQAYTVFLINFSFCRPVPWCEEGQFS